MKEDRTYFIKLKEPGVMDGRWEGRAGGKDGKRESKMELYLLLCYAIIIIKSIEYYRSLRIIIRDIV